MSSLDRRTLLRASGVAIGLPLLESISADEPGQATGPSERRRMVACCLGLGLHAPNLVPEKSGRDYEPTPYLEIIQDFRDDFTLISGTSHPSVDGGHAADKSFLTAAPHPGSTSFRNSISVDQLFAREIGTQTRFGYLALSDYGNSLSVSRNGVPVPGENRASKVFEKLFLEGKPQEKSRQIQRLREGQSVLDVVREKSRQMQRRVSRQDREKLEEYFSAVRETENRLAKAEQWEHKPKPVVDAAPPRDVSVTDVIARVNIMYDLIHLALQTDSTRSVTYQIGGPSEVPQIPGISLGYHNLSHHGKDPAKIEQLTVVETEHIKALANFLRRLKETREQNASLLDNTMVLFGSAMGNASSHSNKNLPIIFAGGGFTHGQHLAFDSDQNYPLANLFVTMLQRLGLPIDRFASSTGTMIGLQSA